MDIVISPEIEAKIGQDDHGNVSRKEVLECFENHCGSYCYDRRPQHLDSEGNPSPWFVAETNRKRKLKIMFVLERGQIFLKSAYPATEEVQRIYAKYAK